MPHTPIYVPIPSPREQARAQARAQGAHSEWLARACAEGRIKRDAKNKRARINRYFATTNLVATAAQHTYIDWLAVVLAVQAACSEQGAAGEIMAEIRDAVEQINEYGADGGIVPTAALPLQVPQQVVAVFDRLAE